jgi:hypothetical protein
LQSYSHRTQAQDKVDGWRNRLGTAGVSVWKELFKNVPKEKIIKDVEFYLDGTDRSRVFYYRSVEQDEETGEVKRKVRP